MNISVKDFSGCISGRLYIAIQQVARAGRGQTEAHALKDLSNRLAADAVEANKLSDDAAAKVNPK